MLRVTCHCENAVKSAKKSFGSSNGKCDSSVADIAGGSTITVFTVIKKSSTYAKNDNTRSSSICNHYDEVIISIKDRGTGIDPSIKDKLFSKFVTKSNTGSGLGLLFPRAL